MFCMKCGKQIGDGSKFCEFCGTAVVPVDAVASAEDTASVAEVISNETVVLENTVTEAPVESSDIASEVKTPKKKMSKRKKIILAVSGTLVAAVATVVLIFYPYIENFIVKTFASDDTYYSYVETKNTERLASSVGSIASLFDRNSDLYNMRASFNVKIGEEVLKTLAARGDFSVDDIKWLSDVGFSMTSAADKNAFAFLLGLDVGGKQALSIDVITDTKTGNLYLRIPQYDEKYLYIDISSFLNNGLYSSNESNYYGDDFEDYLDADLDDYLDESAGGYFGESAVPPIMSSTAGVSYDVLASIMPTEEQLTEMIAFYLEAALSAIDDVDQKSVTVKANGVSQSCTELSYVIDEDTVRDMLVAMLKEVKNDPNLKSVISKAFDGLKKYSQESGMYGSAQLDMMDADMLYQQLEMMAEQLVSQVQYLDIDPINIRVVTWVDSKGDVIGRKISMDGNELRYLIAHNGDDVGIEILFSSKQLGTSFEIVGDGVMDGDLLDADVDVIFGGMHILDVKVENFDTDKIEDGYLNGKITVKIPEATCSLLQSNRVIDANTAELLKGFSLELKVNSDSKGFSVDFTLMLNGEMVVSISSSFAENSASKVAIPKDAVSVDDMQDLENYFQNGKTPQEFLEELTNAIGIPESFIEKIFKAPSYDSDYDYGYDYGDGGYYFDPDLDIDIGDNDYNLDDYLSYY